MGGVIFAANRKNHPGALFTIQLARAQFSREVGVANSPEQAADRQ